MLIITSALVNNSALNSVCVQQSSKYSVFWLTVNFMEISLVISSHKGFCLSTSVTWKIVQMLVCKQNWWHVKKTFTTLFWPSQTPEIFSPGCYLMQNLFICRTYLSVLALPSQSKEEWYSGYNFFSFIAYIWRISDKFLSFNSSQFLNYNPL